jgi:phosphoribosylformylglycinamidine synthase
VSSAHDCSDGGIAIALAECCIANPESESGAEIDLSSWGHLANRALLFGETQGRFVLSSPVPDRVLAIARGLGLSCTRIGTVRRDSPALTISLADGVLRAERTMLRRAYHQTIPEIMSRTPQHDAPAETASMAGH